MVAKVDHDQLLRLVAAFVQICDLYIQMNDLVAGYWFTSDLDARVSEGLDLAVNHPLFARSFSILKKLTTGN